MTSLKPVLPYTFPLLYPGIEDPMRTQQDYAGTTHTPYGPIVHESKQENYTRSEKPLQLGDSRHKELMDGLKSIATALKTKTTEAIEETRPWRG